MFNLCVSDYVTIPEHVAALQLFSSRDVKYLRL